MEEFFSFAVIFMQIFCHSISTGLTARKPRTDSKFFGRGKYINGKKNAYTYFVMFVYNNVKNRTNGDELITIICFSHAIT